MHDALCTSAVRVHPGDVHVYSVSVKCSVNSKQANSKTHPPLYAIPKEWDRIWELFSGLLTSWRCELDGCLKFNVSGPPVQLWTLEFRCSVQSGYTFWISFNVSQRQYLALEQSGKVICFFGGSCGLSMTQVCKVKNISWRELTYYVWGMFQYLDLCVDHDGGKNVRPTGPVVRPIVTLWLLNMSLHFSFIQANSNFGFLPVIHSLSLFILFVAEFKFQYCP